MKGSSVYWSLLVFLLVSQLVVAQEMLTGVVKDENAKPVPDVNLVLREHEGASIKAFGITDPQGRFELKLPPGQDSLFLTITHIAYARQQFYVKTSLPVLEVVLVAQEYELPELIVRNDPVTRRGDTLIFDVSQYRQASDQNIEQVLSKIPGITIESGGRIKYDGLDISRFYIEGLDMLEGRYRIVTRNLNIDAIRDIEIIEHHQPVRALDSLVRPDNAAINLRLRSGLALTGAVQAGAGSAPALYLAGGDVFGFTKKQQFNVLATANNIGEPQYANFQDLYTPVMAPEPDLITINQLLPPVFIKKSAYLDNRELTGGFNFLKKLSETAQLKWQGVIRKDQVRNTGFRSLQYTDGKNEFLFDEQLFARQQPLDAEHRLIYELNTKKRFIRLDNRTSFNFADHFADNRINAFFFPEQLDKQQLENTTALTTIIRHKDKAYKIHTDVQYRQAEDDLYLAPVDIFTVGLLPMRYPEATQAARQKTFRTDIYTNFFFKWKNLTGQINPGFNYQRSSLYTNLLAGTDTTAVASLGQDFRNDNITREFRPYLNQVYKLKGRRFIWELDLPLAASRFMINDKIGLSEKTLNTPVLQPELSVLWQLSAQKNISVAYAVHHAFDQFSNIFYEGYILRSNRNLSTSVFDINRYFRHQFHTRFSSRNIGTSSYYALMATLSQTNYALLNTNSFDQNGLVARLTTGKNKVKRLTLGGELSAVPGTNLQFNLRTQYSFTAQPGVLNESRIRINSHFLTISSKLYYTLHQSVVSLRPGLQLFSNSLGNTPTCQWNAEIVYFLSLPAFGDVSLSYNQYLLVSGGKDIWNELLTLEYRYRFGKLKAEMKLQFQNVTNSTHFVDFSQSTFSTALSYYRLRPRQLVLRLIKKF